MSAFAWSRHARQRAAQRAIPDFHQELLKRFGEAREQPGGTVLLRLPAEGRENVRIRLREVLAQWDHLQDAYAVLASDGTVITVAHERGSELKRIRARRDTARRHRTRQLDTRRRA